MRKQTLNRPPIDRVKANVETGLTSAQVDERIKKGYVNIATDPNEKSTLKIIAENLFTFFNSVLLIIAGVFIIFMIYLTASGHSDIVDKYFGFSKFIFLVPAIMNVAMGTFQEIKSLSVIKKLRIVTGTKSKVIRDGQQQEIEADDIVLDDIVAVSAGSQATADLIVLSGEAEVDESMLTGEADHIKKTAGDTILSGSSIIVGSARCRADKVGNDTYAAELTAKVKNSSGHKSELMSAIMKIIKILTIGLSIAVVVVTTTLMIKIAATGSDSIIWDGMTLSLSDPVTWSLIVLTDGMFGIGMIPTGLVLTTSVAMMVSIAQLTKKQTLVQELYSLENLSRVDVICLDKTGTLTDGTMAVCDVQSYIQMNELKRHIRALMGAFEERNATSEAVFNHFGADQDVDVKEVIPFSSATKFSGLIYRDGKKLLMGAPDYLVDESDARFSYAVEQSKKGNRVIAVTLSGELIAMIAIEDHIRETAEDTLRFFRENGVTVKVISGDNPLTVSRIADKCGIVNSDKYISLAGVPLEDIPGIAEDYTIFGRVSPEQKEALVAALQSNDHKVAMTGDGVNDILALRRSDSSITFAKATDAAKSCSDVVLLDNDFSHLKEVVGEARIGPQMAGGAAGGFLLSLEPRRTPVKGSMMKNIISQSIMAGALASIAVLLPIQLNRVPIFYGLEPFISDANVRPMMTIMTSIAGFVVLFSMCIPFNKYRTKSILAVFGVAVFLGLLLPTSFIGGQAIGASMLQFDASAGQTIFDAQLVTEMFRPMNSPVIRTLIGDPNNFIILRIFLYIAVPAFILTRFAVENYARSEYKDVKKNRAFRIGRRLMLTGGFVLILQSLLSIGSAIISFKQTREEIGIIGFAVLIIIVSLICAVQIAIGVIGYMVWANPTQKMIKLGFISGIVLFVLSILPVILTGSIDNSGDPLLFVDSVVTLIISIGYVIGSFIVRANYKLAREKRT